MTLAVGRVTAEAIQATFEGFRPMSVDAQWRCDPAPAKAFPDATWLDAIFTDDHHVPLLVTDNGVPIGAGIVHKTGQVFWTYASPANYLTMIDQVCRWTVDNLRVIPWAWDERPDGARRKALRTRPDLVTVTGDPKAEPDTVRIEWVATRPTAG